MVSLLGTIALGVGIFFIAVSVVGVIRFPSFCTRVHAAGITDSVGVALVMCGLAAHCGLSVFTVKIFTLVFFLWVTSTTACNLLVHAVCSTDPDGEREE
ncbi:MAG: monovalent cation/H(+) antiporter subunit G [Anaplasma sp.]